MQEQILSSLQNQWGVDVALKKLRPQAQFQMNNNTFVKWFDPSGAEPPTWEEVLEQVERDRLEAQSN